MLNQPTGGFPAIYQEVPSELHMCMRAVYELNMYDITYLHFHNCIEVGMCVSGDGICCINGREYPFKAGDVQIIFPYMNHMHRSNPSSTVKWYWLFIDYNERAGCIDWSDTSRFEQDILSRVATFGIICENEFPKTVSTIKRLFDEAIRDPDNEFAKQKIALNLYLSFIYLLEESAGLPPISLPGNRKDIIKITPALNEIVRRIDHKESISVTELAEACNYSVTSFRRIFTHYFYCSPQQYISICRIRLAKQLLSTSSHSITDIADMVGFENISGFNRAFKNITGVSPSKYRSSLSE